MKRRKFQQGYIMTDQVKDTNEVSKILEQAMAQPGINEIMQVYGNWQKINKAIEPYMSALAPRRIVTISNRSVMNL